MKINELQITPDFSSDKKMKAVYTQFNQLLSELRKKELPEATTLIVNSCIDALNASPLSGKMLVKEFTEKQALLLKHLEKEHKYVPRNHYRNTWMLFGMTGIGLPIGVAFGISMGNLGLLGLGFPIGMAIGMAFGASLDKKALDEGRQLDLEVRP